MKQPTEDQIANAQDILMRAGYFGNMWHKTDIIQACLDLDILLYTEQIDAVMERIRKHTDADWEIIYNAILIVISDDE